MAATRTGTDAQQRLQQSRAAIQELLVEYSAEGGGEFPRSITMRLLCQGPGRRLASAVTTALLMKLARPLFRLRAAVKV